MTFKIKIKGPNKTVATVSDSQFKIVEPIIVSMMNKEITLKQCERSVADTLQQLGDPLVFVAEEVPTND